MPLHDIPPSIPRNLPTEQNSVTTKNTSEIREYPRNSLHVYPEIGGKSPPKCRFAARKTPCKKKSSFRNPLSHSEKQKTFRKNRKIFLPIWKMVVSLHPLSAKKRPLSEGCGNEGKDIEILGSGDSVCRTAAGAADVETPNEFKVQNEAIHTMKSLILAQDER